ncbi:hypothetical protein [Methylobacterium planeticum]|uniref:Uncharacterized protein n=1 Tax=Methylobacterium planeticum TaxID=2615211 RepID=A0A6N6MUJ1_9HYPH|nr:hypothetical protein [Methylobacterium planeticum]KAB1073391.1 hypothetical protein F6X51_11615 [Methylobacterium planeticum]
MPVESWITPEEIPALAAAAAAAIDVALSGLGEAQREAFWHSVRKCYNTPYNDPPPRKRTFAVSAIIAESKARLPLAPPPVPAPIQAGIQAA